MKISVVLPVLAPTQFLRAMTEFAIKTLRLHADNPFELVLVEAEHDHFDPERHPFSWPSELDRRPGHFVSEHVRIDKYLRFNPKQGCIKEFNAGIAAASHEFVVSTGNDVIAPPHWDTELLRCFEERRDCGAAALSAFEPGAIIGPPQALDLLVEGMYSPFMMYRRDWRLDEAYLKIYSDSDLIMRMYEAGLRPYRSCRAHVHHLLRMTSDRVEPEQHARDLAHDERLFYRRWGKSTLAAFGVIRTGQWTYGQEHVSLLRPIQLHYDPTKDEG